MGLVRGGGDGRRNRFRWHRSGSGAELARASGTEWSTFRGPGGRGVAASGQLPLTWSATENVVWKRELPGAGASSPVVFADHIYLTAYTGYLVPGDEEGSPEKLLRHLICLDRKTGTPVWTVDVPARLPEEERIRDHGFAANTPAADALGVVCFFGKSGVMAFDHSGKRIWEANVGDRTHGWGTAASPLFHKDLVIVNASVESESMVALDRKTGKERWRAPGIKEAWNTPVIATAAKGRAELVVAIQGKILAFDPAAGDSLWTCHSDITWYMVPGIVAHEGIVYSLGGRSGIAGLAVRTEGAGCHEVAPAVDEQERLERHVTGVQGWAPVLDARQPGDRLLRESGDGRNRVRGTDQPGGQIYASALLAGIASTTRTGRGERTSSRRSPSSNCWRRTNWGTGSQFNASMGVDGDRLLIRSDKFLYAVGGR